MKITVKENPEAFDREGAALISRQALKKPDTAFCLATGDSTRNIYMLAAELQKELNIDYSLCKTCNLDEYIGISRDDKRSCRFRINETFLNRINIKPENTYVPDGLCEPPEKELVVFREKIESFGGIDLLILGIGTNGHIAFNEPGTPFDSTFRLAPLSEKTRKDKAGFFDGFEKVPKFGITMGIKDIMMAHEILLVAKGRSKAGIISRILQGPIDVDVPASIIMVHPYLSILVDKEAASLL